jgi:hypothetical protein
MGKTGATLITFLDFFIYDAFGLSANLYIYGAVGVLGAIITFFFVDDVDSDRLKSPNVSEEKSIARSAKHTEYV